LSRPRSARPAASGSGRSAVVRPGVFVQTPKSDIYVALLGIALGAMLLGCLLLLLILNQYGFSIKVSALTPPSVASPALAVNTATVNFFTEHL
jgi:hypothetical protein